MVDEPNNVQLAVLLLCYYIHCKKGAGISLLYSGKIVKFPCLCLPSASSSYWLLWASSRTLSHEFTSQRHKILRSTFIKGNIAPKYEKLYNFPPFARKWMDVLAANIVKVPHHISVGSTVIYVAHISDHSCTRVLVRMQHALIPCKLFGKTREWKREIPLFPASAKEVFDSINGRHSREEINHAMGNERTYFMLWWFPLNKQNKKYCVHLLDILVALSRNSPQYYILCGPSHPASTRETSFPIYWWFFGNTPLSL